MRKTLLVTGGSRGIGAATAILAAKSGYEVCVNFLNDYASAARVVDQILANGGKAFAVQADVSMESDVAHLFDQVDRRFGQLDGLVNNVGILAPQSRVEDMDMERIDRIFSTNVKSCFLCCKYAIRQMAIQYGGAGGSIVNVSSIAAKTGAPNEYIDYAASKGAMDTLTIGLAKELAADGIRVNGVRPGFIYTDIHASGGEPDRVDRLKEAIPMNRGGEPREAAHAILWLLSPDSSFSSGTFIDVSGGVV